MNGVSGNCRTVIAIERRPLSAWFSATITTPPVEYVVRFLFDVAEIVNIGRWKIKFDREATLAAYSGVSLGSPESCGCEDCLNLVAARSQAYAPEAMAIFEQLGIDHTKEAETWRMCREESGLHLYGGFFHFIGSIESGKDAVVFINQTGTFDLEKLGDYFEYGFTSNVHLLPESFAGKEIVQLEFQTRTAWVIKTEEPEW